MTRLQAKYIIDFQSCSSLSLMLRKHSVCYDFFTSYIFWAQLKFLWINKGFLQLRKKIFKRSENVTAVIEVRTWHLKSNKGLYHKYPCLHKFYFIKLLMHITCIKAEVKYDLTYWNKQKVYRNLSRNHYLVSSSMTTKIIQNPPQQDPDKWQIWKRVFLKLEWCVSKFTAFSFFSWQQKSEIFM